ncbi:ATP-binding protein, partial [Brevibacillus borstelensis]|uniref:ATP-binding protein n=1 Tax=Brevibacillus borstelensis TaxID=45462 RepID=UPI00203E3D96
AHETGSLSRFFNHIEKLDLLILDELGYIPLHKQGAELLFQIICQYRFNFPQNYRLKIPHFCRYWLFTSAGSGRKKPAFFFSLMR